MENDNFILAEIDIKENDINKDIRIINSFEEVKRSYMIYGVNEDELKIMKMKKK